MDVVMERRRSVNPRDNECGDSLRVVVFDGRAVVSVLPFGVDYAAARLALTELRAANEAAVMYNGNEVAE